MSSLDELMEVMGGANQARIAELEGLVNQARQDYYNGEPQVSDDIYDAWIDELSELKVDSPAVTAVGAPPSLVSAWEKVTHTIAMGSLNKVNTLEELTAWVLANGSNRVEPLICTEKLDGLSISVRYEQGVFSQALTRGDGETGEDISVNVAKMKGIPGRLKTRKSVSLRGEIVLTKSDHAEHFPDYANPRNAASGISKRLDGVGCEHLTIYFYQVADGVDFDNEGQQFEWLESQDLMVPNWYVTAMMPGVKTPHDLWVEYQQTKRAELDYEIDGLVVRINDMEKQLSLGENDGRPKGAIAFKFAPMTRETTLRRIDWQVGGSGRITPVAIFDPVKLVGAEITNASLYNHKYIQDLGADIGATVLIARANDVIPRVVSVIRPVSTVAQAPQECPACQTPTQMDGVYLVCPNEVECSAQTVGRIKRYLRGLDIKEWGEVLVEKLVEGGFVKSVPDLYRLTKDRLATIDHMGEKSAEKVYKTLREKNPVPLDVLLGSMSIPNVGSSTIKNVIDAGFDTIGAIKGLDINVLASIDGLGSVKAGALHKWLQENEHIVDDLREVGVKIKAKVQGTLTGKQVCFTGSLSRPRRELEALVTAAGGEVKNSVTKKLAYLVMANPNSDSSKAKAARKNGTQCISEDILLELVGT